MMVRPPLSLRIPVDRLPKTGRSVSLSARDGQLAAIAAQLGLPRIESLDADVTVAPAGGGRFRASGEVRARVWRTCVVTLEDFPTEIAAPIEAVFATPELLPAPTRQEVERLLSDEDPPEPLEDGAVDAGALAVEFLALSLDPYPRRPGAALDAEADAEQEPPRENPFAALAALKGLKS